MCTHLPDLEVLPTAKPINARPPGASTVQLLNSEQYPGIGVGQVGVWQVGVHVSIGSRPPPTIPVECPECGSTIGVPNVKVIS